MARKAACSGNAVHSRKSKRSPSPMDLPSKVILPAAGRALGHLKANANVVWYIERRLRWFLQVLPLTPMR